MKNSMIALSLLLQFSFANAGSTPQVGIYRGTENGTDCSLEIVKVVTNKTEIKKLNQRDIDLGVLTEADLPNYMLLAKFNGSSKVRLVSGAENMNMVSAEDRAAGGEHRLSGGEGLLPLPIGWFVNLIINQNRQPISYSVVSVPFGKSTECKDLR